MLFFIFHLTVASSDICYVDEGAKTYCYYDKGFGSWNDGNTLCRSFGGQLPVIWLAGKQDFLNSNFSLYYWISLRTDAKRYSAIFNLTIFIFELQSPKYYLTQTDASQ